MRKQIALIVLAVCSQAMLVSNAIGQNRTNTGATQVPATTVLTNSSSVQTTNGNPTGANSLTSSNSLSQNLLLLPDFTGTNFLVVAAMDSLLEIEIGAIAQTNSSNTQVQQFGQVLVADHTAAYNQAVALANSSGLTNRSFNNVERGIIARFQGLTGDQFDIIFTRYMIQAHDQDIARFDVAATRASSHEVRQFAAANIPVLVKHLELAFNIRESLLGNQALTNP